MTIQNLNPNPLNLDSPSYKAFKDRAMNAIHIRRETALSDIEIISDEIISVTGVNIPITPKAFFALVKLLGLNKTSVENFGEILGAEAKKALVNLMRKAVLSNQDKNKVVLLMNSETKTITDVIRNVNAVLTNGAFFSLFEDVMNANTGMVIKNMAVNHQGHIEISVINPNWEFDIAGLKDEYFHTGMVFILMPDQTIICPFNERLTCTNGMVTQHKGTSLILKNSDATSINGFFDKVREIKDMSYFQHEFKARASKLMTITASFNELNFAKSTVEAELDMNDMWNKAKIEQFFDYQFVVDSYAAQKFDLLIAHKDDKIWKQAKTDKTVWELVNALTDISSHADRDKLHFREKTASVFRLQRSAGALFFKEPLDLEYEHRIPKVF